jgi:outer membrane receptor protein involved in Fe transport
MGNSFRNHALSGLAKTASSALIFAMLAGGSAYAQGAPAEDVVDEADIIVTARQRNETLQDVPVTVTSISEQNAGNIRSDQCGQA